MSTNNNETTTLGPGAQALEDCEKAYADMTATEVEIGFGDCHCDWRAPLAKVEIFKKAEAEAADTSKTTIYTYNEAGEEVTGAAAKDKADELHAATEKKKELLKKYYPDVYAERYPEAGSATPAEDVPSEGGATGGEGGATGGEGGATGGEGGATGGEGGTTGGEGGATGGEGGTTGGEGGGQ